MRNYFSKIFLVVALACATMSFGQSESAKMDDEARIALTPFLPYNMEGMPASSRKYLESKLRQIVTKNGISADVYFPRFVITTNIDVLSKDLTSTAPVMTALNLNVVLYIGDGQDGTLFASTAIEVKGVGNNENRAYMSALKRINVNNPQIKKFIEEGKQKIISYYNTQCDFIITEAKTLESQNKFGEAIAKLLSVPSVSKECFDKCNAAAVPLYKKFINQDCKEKLAKANAVWNSGLDRSAAEEAGAILVSIDPNAACFKEVQSLMKKIGTRVKELDSREWNYVLKEQSLEGDYIKAMRDVGVAWGEGQPKTVNYNVRGWF